MNIKNNRFDEENAYQYAKDLAFYLWHNYYKADTPEWKPCDDLMGVLTQIDNMIVGLKNVKKIS